MLLTASVEGVQQGPGASLGWRCELLEAAFREGHNSVSTLRPDSQMLLEVAPGGQCLGIG